MPSTDDSLTVTTDIDAETLHDALRHGLVVVVLLVIGALATLLPGGWREIPGTPVSVEALLTATVALAVVTTIVLASPAIGALVRAAVEGPPAAVDDLASAARYGLVFLAVLVAHAGLAPTVVPLLARDSVWVYDVAFLGFALFPLVAIGRRLYRSSEPVARALSQAVVETSTTDPGDSGSSS